MRLVTLAIAALALSGCGGGASGADTAPAAAASSGPATTTVTGTITVPVPLSQAGGRKEGVKCSSDAGYTDIALGAQIEVTDAGPAGGTLGVGTLDQGTSDGYSSCIYSFAIPGVPLDRQFYAVTVGNANRGSIKYDRAQIAQPISLTLGD